MYCLTDDIARRRMLYSAPIFTVASVLVVDLPLGSRGPGLSLGRYYAIFLETERERAEVDAFLTAPRAAPVPPSLLDRRPSQLQTDQVVITRYEPPAPGWPLLSVCRWPLHGTNRGPHEDMARGCYTMEMFESATALEAHQAALLTGLAGARRLEIRLIAADGLPATRSC